jgi:hypothetical protein
VCLHEVFAKGLAALHTGGSLIGTEALDFRKVLSEVVDDAGNERSLRTRDKEVDRVVAGEVDQSREVVGLDVLDIGDLGRETVRLRLSMDAVGCS